MRKNPAVPLLVKPLVPYIVVGGVLYFFWDKILAAVAGRITGTGAAAIKADITTIKSGSVKELGTYVGGALLAAVGLGKPVGVASQQAADQIKTAIAKGWVTLAELPYPAANTAAQFAADKEYINKKMLTSRTV